MGCVFVIQHPRLPALPLFFTAPLFSFREPPLLHFHSVSFDALTLLSSSSVHEQGMGIGLWGLANQSEHRISLVTVIESILHGSQSDLMKCNETAFYQDHHERQVFSSVTVGIYNVRLELTRSVIIKTTEGEGRTV